MKVHDKLYIDGAWVPSAGNGSIEVYQLLDGRSSATIPEGTAADVDRAARPRQAAFEDWAETSPEERAQVLQPHRRRARRPDGRDRHDRPGRGGMPKWLSLIVQAGLPIKRSSQAAAQMLDELPVRGADRQQLVVREPVGVVGCITPWNYPLHQIVAKVAPATGRRLHGRRSSRARSRRSTRSSSPRSSTRSACRPACSTSSPAPVPWSARRSPRIPRSTWCRSPARPAPGKRVSRGWRRRRVKRVALELGGKSANIMLDDLDDATFEQAVRDGVGKVLPELGSDLHRPHPHAGAASTAGRTSSASRPTRSRRSVQPCDPFAEGRHDRPAGRRSPSVERVHGLHPEGHRRGRQARDRWRGAPEGSRAGYFVRPTVFCERHATT